MPQTPATSIIIRLHFGEVPVILLLGMFITLLGPHVVASHPENNPQILFVAAQFNSISGHVSDDRRVGIPELQVELLNDADSVIQRTETDSSGLFVFRRLSIGIFNVRVQTTGTSYISQTIRIEVARGGDFQQVDIVLAAKKTSSPSGAPGEVFVQDVPERARKEYERGASLLKKTEQRKEALETLKKALDIFPRYFDALELLGTDYVKQQEYEAAIPVLTKAIEVNGRGYQSLYTLSVAQYNLKQVPEAIETMKRAIAIDQRSTTANLWLGMLLRQTAKLDEAEPYLKQADKLAASKSPEVHWQLALLFNQLKRYKEAADELELFLKVQPDSKDTEGIKKLIRRFREQSGVKQ